MSTLWLRFREIFRDTPKMAKEALVEYFKPLTWLFGVIKKCLK